MSVALISPRYNVQEITPTADVTPVHARPSDPVTPIEILLYTSRNDFSETAQLFEQECTRAGVHGRVLYVEDLDGVTSDDKLIREHQLMGELLERGEVNNGTFVLALNHGCMSTDLCYHETDPFIQYIARTGGEYEIADSSHESIDDSDGAHVNEKISMRGSRIQSP